MFKTIMNSESTYSITFADTGCTIQDLIRKKEYVFYECHEYKATNKYQPYVFTLFDYDDNNENENPHAIATFCSGDLEDDDFDGREDALLDYLVELIEDYYSK